MKSLGVALLLFALVNDSRTGLGQEGGTAIIEGTVFDIHEALIVGVWISIENTQTGEARNLRTDNSGRYSASVPAGRYRVTMQPSAGDPFGYRHTPFAISSAERVIVNFRPKPFAVSDSIEAGHWIERYEGEFPIYTTHFIQQPSGAIKELQIQSDRMKTRGRAFEHRLWVIASFDRLTIYAERASFDPKTARLLAEGDVIFEDGKQVRKAKRVELDLTTGSTNVVGATTDIKKAANK